MEFDEIYEAGAYITGILSQSSGQSTVTSRSAPQHGAQIEP